MGTFATLLAVATACGDEAPSRPSLLLITTSGLRADTLPCYEGEGPATSTGTAICGLAERGALFVWAFTTTPAVAPSATTLLTSQYPSEHGVTPSAATFLRTGATTLAGEFQASGYATAAFIAASELNRSRNLQLGFDLYEAGVSESLAQAAERVAARATEWLAAASQFERPYFVWVHFPATSTESAPPLRGLRLGELDDYVRRLVDAARANGSDAAGSERDSPGIAFAALSGTEEQGDARPLDLARVRIPMIWSPPGGVAPQRLLAPSPLLDIAPTLLHSAGLVVPESFAGEGLRVGLLPPTAPQPARPLELEGGDERGLVLSRRYYAKSIGGSTARTALLSNDGVLPRTRSVATSAHEVSVHERLLSDRHAPAGATPHPESPLAKNALERPNGTTGNDLFPMEENVLPPSEIGTPSR